MTNEQIASERISRLEVGGVWVVKEGAVNLDDLLYALKPGQRIVRVRHPASVDDIRFMPVGDAEQLGCVAGWVSDDDCASPAPPEPDGWALNLQRVWEGPRG